MSRKTLIKTVLIILVAPFLAAIMIWFIGGGILASSVVLLLQGAVWAEEKPDQIIFVNESSSQVSSVMISAGLVDGSTVFSLGGEEKLTIEWNSWPCRFSAVNAQGDALAELVISEDPDESMARDQWYVIAQDGHEGVILTLSHVRDLEDVLDWGNETSGLDLSGGMIQQFIYRHGSFGDGDSLLVMSFTPEQGAELEQAMAQTNGWHEFPTHELLDKIFFDDHSYCRDTNRENYLPAVENGWFFFRNTFNVQHGKDDEHQWALDGYNYLPGNFDAGIYDSDTCTLYLFEYDS